MAFLEKTEMTLCDPGRYNDFLLLTPKDFTRNDYSPLDLAVPVFPRVLSGKR